VEDSRVNDVEEFEEGEEEVVITALTVEKHVKNMQVNQRLPFEEIVPLDIKGEISMGNETEYLDTSSWPSLCRFGKQ
jgi:hypothetical protein